MRTPAASLAQLAEVAKANGYLTGQAAEEALSEALGAVLELKGASGWASLEGEEVSAVALTRALGDILKDTEAGLQGRAATVYAAILSVQDAPVGTLCEPYAFSAFVHCLRNICLPSKCDVANEGATQLGYGIGEQIGDASPLGLLEDLGTFLKHHSMRGSPEMFQLLLETIVDLTSSAGVSGKPEKGSKRGGAAARSQGVSVAEAAFGLLSLAMDPRHGSVVHVAAVICHRLTPVLVGLDAGKRSGQGLDRRTVALNLVRNFFSAHDAARPCRTALMRRLCVRAPDKADCRQMALGSVQALMPGCTPAEVRAFGLFLYRLSRTPKTAHRMIAVDLAAVLLSTMPAPFTATGPYRRLVDGSCASGDQLEAPWSAVCLAIIVSRSNDKSASVRGKAIGCLADTVQTFAKRLRDAADGGQETADTAGFLHAICAARQIHVQVSAPRGVGTGGVEEGGSDNDEDYEGAAAVTTAVAGGEDSAAQAAPPREAKVAATIPGKVSLELSWMRVLCHNRCRDEKAAVRKVALLLLESVLELCAVVARSQPSPSDQQAAGGPSAEDVQVLEDATADSLVSVRKTALQVVCNLAACYTHHADLACVWARCVLPLIRDPESSIQEVVMERLSILLLEPLAIIGRRVGGGRSRGDVGGGAALQQQQQACAEVRQRLAALARMGRAASSCLGKALGMMAAKKLLKGPQVAAGLEAFLTAEAEKERDAAAAAAGGGAALEKGSGAGHRSQKDAAQEQRERERREREQRRVARDQREGAWMLLVEVAGQDPAAPSWQFLQRCWDELQAAGAAAAGGEASAQEGAMLLWVISHAASRFPAADAANLASGLLLAILGFNLPCAAVAAHLGALHKLTQAEGGQAVVGQPATWCTRVQAACEEVLVKAMESRGNMSNALAIHCQLALFTLGEVALLRETALPGGAAVKVQALTYERNVNPDGPAATRVAQAAVSAHAWNCLGKMCMVDEALAKKCVPLLVQEMSGSPSPVVRTNLLVALADMVVQFTGLADAYVGRLADMVRDPHELVRRQALALLANLLLRDYVKWRGSLVHRFLLALVDESPGVRQLAQYLLSDSLAAKAPMLAYNHFIESLFVLNACSAGLHASRAGGAASAELASELALHSSQEGGSTFHLKGSTPITRAKRDIIYTALLRRMSPEHRFSAFARLTAEVLGGVVDGLLPLAEADEVLGDALRLLACKDMKVNANRFGVSAEEDAEQLTGTQEDAAKARGKLVGAMMRKHLVESVVPLMVELRYMLQAQKHPLLGSLMLCMATLLRDYKSEVEDILVSDKQLTLEIMHDLKHYETVAKQQHQQQEAAMAAVLGQEPFRAGPCPSNASAPTQDQAAVPVPAAAALSHLAMPPRQAPAGGGQSQRQSVVLPGVEPTLTPVAAEVLVTASKRGRNDPRQRAHHTPYAAAGFGDGPSTAVMTPAAGLQGPGAGAAAAMRTPRTGVPGTAQRGIPGGISVMLSPAPLSTRARAAQQRRVPGAAMVAPPLAANGAPRAKPADAAMAADAAAAAVPDERVTIVLPSPLPSSQQNLAARPLGPHNPSADAQGKLAAPGMPSQRTPPALLAAAVRAARQAAAAALGDDENGGGRLGEGDAGAGPMDVDVRGEADRKTVGIGSDLGGKGGRVGVSVKQEVEAAAAGNAGVVIGPTLEIKEEVKGASRGGKGRTGKRRHGAA